MPYAAQNREAALAESVITEDDPNAPGVLKAWLQQPDQQRRGGHGRGDHIRLFDPTGKARMIDGGVGCVRLKPLAERAPYRWLFGASSTAVMHEGLPVALSDDCRDDILKSVRRAGGVRCTIQGVLRFIPRDDTLTATYGRGIPQVYLEAREPIEADHGARASAPIEVTAVATFLSQAEKYQGMNASYVTFLAGSAGDLENSVEWLEQVYVRGAYQGRIMTDFDEQTQRFANAPFSLNKLMNGLARRDETEDVFESLNLSDYERAHLLTVWNKRRIYVQGDAYFVDQAGVVGPNAQGSNITFNNNAREDR